MSGSSVPDDRELGVDGTVLRGGKVLKSQGTVVTDKPDSSVLVSDSSGDISLTVDMDNIEHVDSEKRIEGGGSKELDSEEGSENGDKNEEEEVVEKREEVSSPVALTEIGALAQMMKNLAVQMSSMNQKFDGMKEDNRKMEGRMKEENKNNLEAQKQGFEGMKEDIKRNFEAQGQKFERIEQKFEKIEENFVAQNQKIEGMEERIEQKFEEIRESVTTQIKQELNGIEGRIQENLEKKMDEKLEGIEEKVSQGMAPQIKKMEEICEANEQVRKDQSKKMEEWEEKLQENDKKVENVVKHLEDRAGIYHKSVGTTDEEIDEKIEKKVEEKVKALGDSRFKDQETTIGRTYSLQSTIVRRFSLGEGSFGRSRVITLLREQQVMVKELYSVKFRRRTSMNENQIVKKRWKYCCTLKTMKQCKMKVDILLLNGVKLLYERVNKTNVGSVN